MAFVRVCDCLTGHLASAILHTTMEITPKKTTPLVMCATAQDACNTAIGQEGKTPINLFGFSGQGYEPPGFSCDLRKRLGDINPEDRSKFVLVTGPGAGGSGIDGGAKIAKEMGFGTVGVVSDAIMEYGAPNDPAFDKIAVVASNGSWGGTTQAAAGKNPRDLSVGDMEAVSQAMVILGTRPGASNISYGGGVVSQQECCALANAGGKVAFVPCQINVTAQLSFFEKVM